MPPTGNFYIAHTIPVMLVSFNKDAHVPNWVAWELTADEVAGTVPRAKDFLVRRSALFWIIAGTSGYASTKNAQ